MEGFAGELVVRIVRMNIQTSGFVLGRLLVAHSGHLPKRRRLLSANGLNRSRGRALRRVAWPWMDDGSVLPDDEGPEIVQHDDRAISHRQRWERTELSVTTSASRIVSNTRTDAVEDAVMIYKANSKQFRWTLSRGNICSTDAVQRLLSGT
jgi:hypothetical protein